MSCKDSGTDFMDFHVAGDSIYISKAHFCLVSDAGHWGFGEWAQGEINLILSIKERRVSQLTCWVLCVVQQLLWPEQMETQANYCFNRLVCFGALRHVRWSASSGVSSWLNTEG